MTVIPGAARGTRAEITRRALVSSGRELFGALGYASTTVDQVVRHAGVTKGALYHHFKDKDELFRAVVEEVKLEVTQRAADAYFAAAEGTDPDRSLRLTCLALIDASLDPTVQRIAVLDARSVLDASYRRQIEARYEVALLRGALRGAMRAGTLEPQPYITLAHLLSGAINEACALVADSDDQGAARAEVNAVITRLLDGLRPSG